MCCCCIVARLSCIFQELTYSNVRCSASTHLACTCGKSAALSVVAGNASLHVLGLTGCTALCGCLPAGYSSACCTKRPRGCHQCEQPGNILNPGIDSACGATHACACGQLLGGGLCQTMRVASCSSGPTTAVAGCRARFNLRDYSSSGALLPGCALLVVTCRGESSVHMAAAACYQAAHPWPPPSPLVDNILSE
jgi:hypothetical protein